MNAARQQLDAVRCQPMKTAIGRSFISRNKVLTVNEQISASSLGLCADSFVQNLTPLLAKEGPAEMRIATERLPYIEKLATLTLQYLELSLSLPAALRAAEADLSPTAKQ
jgi:hypothetical protein